MSYQVIARRWRPKTFDEVVGQEHITKTLQNAIKLDRLAHAFLFTGPRGVGKTSTARILARVVNCVNAKTNNFEPCNQCETCIALLEDREMDVIEMDAASNNGVDDIRRVIDNSRLMPIVAAKKMYILDEVHMLSKSAFNAFLKTLEEPPEHVIFILATTDVQKVPRTILSRVQRFDFRSVNPAVIAKHLGVICQAEGWEAEPEALWLIAERAEGGLRDAEGYLDQVIAYAGTNFTLDVVREVLGAIPTELFTEATQLISEKNLSSTPEYLEKLAGKGVDYTEYLKGLQNYWMDSIFLLQNLEVKGKSEAQLSSMKAATGDLKIEDFFRLLRLAQTLESEIKWSPTPRIRFDVTFLRWAALDRAASLKGIIESIKNGAVQQVSSQPAAATEPTKKAEPAKPLPVQTAKQVEPTPPSPQTATQELSFELLESVWPEVIQKLCVKKVATGEIAKEAWTLGKLDGKKLSVCTSLPGKFALDKLKETLPLLTEFFSELTGQSLTLLALQSNEPSNGSAAAPQTTTPASTQTNTSGNDLFGTVMQRFGGVEIGPGSA